MVRDRPWYTTCQNTIFVSELRLSKVILQKFDMSNANSCLKFLEIQRILYLRIAYTLKMELCGSEFCFNFCRFVANEPVMYTCFVPENWLRDRKLCG
jgi:hypothetical protein